uniref:Uncharacterized protein n=1 Tax=Romanomermis culicivorax TaxID=13658 RepID=A0A915K7X4_ROMCU
MSTSQKHIIRNLVLSRIDLRFSFDVLTEKLQIKQSSNSETALQRPPTDGIGYSSCKLRSSAAGQSSSIKTGNTNNGCYHDELFCRVVFVDFLDCAPSTCCYRDVYVYDRRDPRCVRRDDVCDDRHFPFRRTTIFFVLVFHAGVVKMRRRCLDH